MRATDYHGKQLDGTADTLRMALDAAGTPSLPHAECFTGRPFAHRSAPGDPSQWLTPYLGPWEGLQNSLDVLGLRAWCLRYERHSAEAGDRFLAAVTQRLPGGPVVVGPLNRSSLWDRVEARYYPGAAHFVLVLGTAPHGRLLVHDPEGSPWLPLSAARLRAALDAPCSPAGALQLHGVPARPRIEMLLRALDAGRSVRAQAAVDPEGGAEGLATLARSASGRPLRSAEEAALFFALPALGLARLQLARFLEELAEQPGVPGGLAAGAILLDRFSRGCARALDALRRRDWIRLSRTLAFLAYVERRIDVALGVAPAEKHRQ